MIDGRDMSFDEYRVLAQRTDENNILIEKLNNGCLGLAGEAGEVIDIFKKYRYQKHPLDVKGMVEELGDVLWYIAAIATAVGVPMGEIAARNIEKLNKRYPEGFDAERSVNRDGGSQG